MILGLVLWVFLQNYHPKINHLTKLWSSITLFLITSTLLFIFFYLVVQWSPLREDPFHSKSNLCHLDQSANVQCACLSPAIYGPQFFLEKDYRPCTGILPTLAPGFFVYPSLIKAFSERYKTEPIAILWHEKIPTPYIPTFFKELIKQSDCQPFDAISEICKYQK
jgi:hypothetical protein